MTAPWPSPARMACRPQDLGRLMPMFLWLDPRGCALAAGPTLRKVLGRPVEGCALQDLFTLIHPRRLDRAADLAQRTPIRLALPGAGGAALRGTAVALDDDSLLMNLSFGPELAEAVRAHELSDSDFAATDLAFELLYLAEANSAVIAEARKFAERLHAARAQAMEQALSDPLTGLRNRRALDRMAARLSQDRTPFGLIHIDLDHFKAVNDTFGHGAGDLVLRVVARRLTAALREMDCVARIGGDEFVVVLPGLHGRGPVRRIARRLLAAILRPIAPDPGARHAALADAAEDEGRALAPDPLCVSASLGVALWDGHAPTRIEALLDSADRALYRSKAEGRGRISFADPG